MMSEEDLPDLLDEYFNPPRPTPDEMARYRRMTTGERMEETLRLTEEWYERLHQYPKEEVAHFFEVVGKEGDEGNLRLLEGLARSKRREEMAADRDDSKTPPD